ncbi:MAG TPA: hypothetical protein VFR67_25205 [Pilimelia sp.]|nr:hypothetical protein [Pilimelia sp.]
MATRAGRAATGTGAGRPGSGTGRPATGTGGADATRPGPRRAGTGGAIAVS